MQLSNERYEEIKEEVTDLYKELNITSFPINAMSVCQKLGIELKSYNQFNSNVYQSVIRASEDGIVAKIDNQYVIYYNPSKDVERIRFTVFHEIGHIRLRHLIHDDENETEANFFACYFLVPTVLIHTFGFNCIQDIMDKFWVSFSVASHSFDRYKKWIQYSGFYYTQYEEELIKLIMKKENFNYA